MGKGVVGLDLVPPRVKYIMDRKELTGGKISTKQRQILDHHYLLQREFKFKAKAEARRAKKASDEDEDEDDDEDEDEEEGEKEDEGEEEEGGDDDEEEEEDKKAAGRGSLELPELSDIDLGRRVLASAIGGVSCGVTPASSLLEVALPEAVEVSNPHIAPPPYLFPLHDSSCGAPPSAGVAAAAD
eukprot:CAMPEP_0185692914 /NCGR_PEP_ID=MMETSP1164-20130828/2873_1 /TAXON_ID=1104430 /ORGANISM="Chrysoreinhardia sp, Strain CCMP2950" /LENGTH=184 /DNA_ID=CAMNT_0028359671 /DNA_START=61 /DNA_END=613 /DNA_ORIENTATION=-